jgi:hypothetical protein
MIYQGAGAAAGRTAPFGLDNHGCGAQAEELGAHPIAGVGGIHFEEQEGVVE